MNLSHRIQAKTDNGDTVIDFLIEVMQGLPRTRYGDERDGFKTCHRLDAARLLTRYGCSCKSTVAERDDAIDFIIDNAPEPSGPRSDCGSSTESTFDITLAKKIKESTDDGASVVRFLINVMQGELKAFGPHHSMAAARELLSRGFGKHAREEAALTSSSPRRSGEPVPGLIRDPEPRGGRSGRLSLLTPLHSLLSPCLFRRVPGRHRDSRPRRRTGRLGQDLGRNRTYHRGSRAD